MGDNIEQHVGRGKVERTYYKTGICGKPFHSFWIPDLVVKVSNSPQDEDLSFHSSVKHLDPHIALSDVHSCKILLTFLFLSKRCEVHFSKNKFIYEQ